MLPPCGLGAFGSIVIVPRMNGCGRQKYQYTPGSVNIKLKLWPTCRSPESHNPLSEVVVCTVGPLFVQVIVVPGGTDTPKTPGLKSKSSTVTFVTERAVGATCVAGAAGAGAGPSEPWSEKTHSVSPRGKSSWKLPPEASATYCCPSTRCLARTQSWADMPVRERYP